MKTFILTLIVALSCNAAMAQTYPEMVEKGLSSFNAMDVLEARRAWQAQQGIANPVAAARSRGGDVYRASLEAAPMLHYMAMRKGLGLCAAQDYVDYMQSQAASGALSQEDTEAMFRVAAQRNDNALALIVREAEKAHARALTSCW